MLLLALAAVAYFVLKGPDRNRNPVESTVGAPGAPNQAALPVVQAPPDQKPQPTDDQQVSEDKKKTADARKQTAQEAAAIEAERKAAENKSRYKAESQPSSPHPSAPATPSIAVPDPADADALPEHSSAPGREGCVIVTVMDSDGSPVQGARVGVADQPDNGASILHNGRTGPKGRWQNCGFTPGHQIRVAVFGPRGAMLGTQQSVVAAGRNFVEIRIQRKSEEGPQLGPKNRRPLFKRP
jgi:hypothetical protein